jgi:hypothetical protein
MIRAGISLPALMQLMGHAQIQTTMVYLQLTPQDVREQYARAVAQLLRSTPPVAVMKRQPLPLPTHPLTPVFGSASESVTTFLGPASFDSYRRTVRHFLTYLAAQFPEVHSLQQLRRDPHILSWLAFPAGLEIVSPQSSSAGRRRLSYRIHHARTQFILEMAAAIMLDE